MAPLHTPVTPALLIVDLEATCWERPEHRPAEMETIEIGALRIAAAPGASTAESPQSFDVREFQTFVRPLAHPALSPFCRELTTISQAQVDAAATFPQAFARFLAWVGEPREVVFASWGEFDARQFQRDCVRHRVRYPFAAHRNLKRVVARRSGGRGGAMGEALAACGLAFEGTLHRGIDDARNLWRLLRVLFADDLAELLAEPTPGERHRGRGLERFLRLVLRHRPEDFGLAPDEQGFVDAAELRAVVERHAVPRPGPEELARLLTDPEGQFEQRGERLRFRPPPASRTEFPVD